MELVILYLLMALSVSFLCSVLEAVLLSTPMSFITMKEKEGAKNASIMMKQKQNIDLQRFGRDLPAGNSGSDGDETRAEDVS